MKHNKTLRVNAWSAYRSKLNDRGFAYLRKKRKQVKCGRIITYVLPDGTWRICNTRKVRRLLRSVGQLNKEVV